MLVYDVCKVKLGPKCSRQLNDIAISAAQSAKMYNKEPRVAILSYATGEAVIKCVRRLLLRNRRALNKNKVLCNMMLQMM